jgi:hypothetical protein
VPGALHAGAWRTKQLHTHDKYEPKSRSRRTSDQFDEKIIIVRGALDFEGDADAQQQRQCDNIGKIERDIENNT